MSARYQPYNLNFADFELFENQFDHHSKLHGISHTYRVMVHTLRLGKQTGFIHEARLAFFAAFIHDMARRHDGYCTRHGADAAVMKLPLHQDLFLKNGATAQDLKAIARGAALHSTDPELPAGDPDYLTVAILKDADALDRIRLGEDDLDPSFLRLKQSHDCIPFSRLLYHRTVFWRNGSFTDFLKLSESLEQ